jgi:hypothetical protein
MSDGQAATSQLLIISSKAWISGQHEFFLFLRPSLSGFPSHTTAVWLAAIIASDRMYV